MNIDQVASLDFETGSLVDLRKAGAARYAEDPSTRVICLAYELPDGLGVRHWQEGMDFPKDLWDWVDAGKTVSAWNALFEWNIWNKVLGRNPYFRPILHLSQLVDTMAVAANNGLPLSLDAAAGAVPGLGVVKDKQGHSVMLRMSRPRTVAADGTLEWWDRTDPAKLDRLVEYCKQDVRVERALARVLRPMSAAECEVWQMDAEATARGVLFDADLAGRMSIIAREEALRLDARMRAVTGGAVKTTRAVGQLLDWVQVHEPKVKSLPKDQLAEWIGKLDPGPVREALEIRQEAAKSSLAKLDSMRAYASAVDGRMRGLTVYGGAFRTLRWAGRGPQVQNYARSAVKDQDALVGYIKGGGDAEGFEPFFGVTPLTGLSSALRGCLTVPKGKVMGALDFKQIEARVLPWLAGDDALLDVFRSGKDIYVTAAAGIYGIPEGLVSEAQRQTGKVSVLACIAKGELVLTDRGLVPIEQVCSCSRVWDGVEWVQHDGVISRGFKKVTDHDGLRATADHIVWTAKGPTQFGHAAASGTRLVRSGAGGDPLWVGDDHQPRKTLEDRVAGPEGVHPMQWLRGRGVDQPEQPDARCLKGVPDMHPTPADPDAAGQVAHCGEATLREPQGPELAELRRAGHRIPLPVCDRCGGLGVGEPWSPAGSDLGPDRQQRPLRTGEPALGVPENADDEQAGFGGVGSGLALGGDGKPLQPPHDPEVSAGGVYPRPDHGSGVDGGGREAEELAGHPDEVEVFDILNAGPRNRFTVSGRLVHNCGYQGGVGAFQNMAKVYGLKVSDDEAEAIKVAWREANPRIVALWYAMQDAALRAMGAVGARGGRFHAGRCAFERVGVHLQIKLPSGRSLVYRDARVEVGDFGRDVVTYMGMDQYTRQWKRISTYGGKLVENVTQAVARDLLASAMLRMRREGIAILVSIHDEVLMELDRAEDFARAKVLMEMVPAWAVGLPIGADGYVGTRFRK